MSAKDRMELASEQVSNLIDLVADGQDPDDLINATVEEISEGYGGGPYPIGSKVKVNQPWTGEAIGGGNASLSKDEFVWILQTGLGEKGYDRIVLFPNGTTKAIVPLKILGEEEIDEVNTQPAGYAIKGAGGSPGGSKSGKSQGEPPPKSPPQPQRGKLTSIPSTFVGKGKPKDDPAAQPAPAMAPVTISGKAVEDVQNEVLTSMTEMMKRVGSPEALSVIRGMIEDLQEQDEPVFYAIVHQMLYGDDEITLSDLDEVYKACKKKKAEKPDEGFTEDDIAEVLRMMAAQAAARKKRGK